MSSVKAEVVGTGAGMRDRDLVARRAGQFAAGGERQGCAGGTGSRRHRHRIAGRARHLQLPAVGGGKLGEAQVQRMLGACRVEDVDVVAVAGGGRIGGRQVERQRRIGGGRTQGGKGGGVDAHGGRRAADDNAAGLVRRPALDVVAVLVDQVGFLAAGRVGRRGIARRHAEAAIPAVDGRAGAVGIGTHHEEAVAADGDVERPAGGA